MSSDRSSTATNSPKRLVTADNSTARSVPGPAPLVSGECSFVLLSCNPLPPVRVALRKLSLQKIIRPKNGRLRAKVHSGERREHLPRRPLAGGDGSFHVAAPLRGGLRPGPIDAPYGFLQRGTVIQDHARRGYPRVAAAGVDLC